MKVEMSDSFEALVVVFRNIWWTTEKMHVRLSGVTLGWDLQEYIRNLDT